MHSSTRRTHCRRPTRELIGAYVSSLNGCAFCRASHAAIAACHLDGDEAFVETVLSDPRQAPISGKLRALLAIAARVQRNGRRRTRRGCLACARGGRIDLEIDDTILIASLFCFFNRYVDGLGAWTPADPEAYRQRARLTAQHGYAASLAQGTPGL